MYFVILLCLLFLVIISHREHLGESVLNDLIANFGKPAQGKESK